MRKLLMVSILIAVLLSAFVPTVTEAVVFTEVNIQKEIDAVGQGDVQLKPVTYNISNPIIIPTGINLIGRGYATELKAVSDTRVIISEEGAHDFSISKLRVNGNKVDIDILACFGGNEDVRIKNVTVMNGYHYGIFFGDCNDVTVVKSRFLNNGCIGGDSALFFARGQDNKVINNYFKENQNAVSAQGLSDSMVRGNTIIDSVLDGVNLTSGTNGRASDNIVLFNRIRGVGGIGIMLNQCDSSVVSSNRISGSGTHGIDIDNSNHNIISGNIVTESDWAGIVLYSIWTGEEIGSNHNNIFGNILMGNARTLGRAAIKIDEWCNYNNIHNNIARVGTSPNHRYGIHVYFDSIGNILAENDLHNGYLDIPICDQGTDTVIRNNRS